MTAASSVHHDAKPSRRPDGFKRWFAVCPCGWVRPGGSREGAHHLADLHNRMNPERTGAA